MEWNPEQIVRLYDLYEQHAARLRADIVRANHSLGSPHPERTKLEIIDRDEFATLLTQPSDDPEAVRRWVRQIIRGHEHDFPELEAA